MGAAQVVVVGSLNMDLVARAPSLPRAGETLLGSRFTTVPGGKGANQAVAAARLGARTAMIGCLGDDAFGQQLRAGLEADGVDCGGVRTVEGESSGVALIVVDEAGGNGIVVVPGSNAALSPADVEREDALLARASVVALQLEIPLATVERAAARARALGRTVVLNPAPARPLPEALVAAVDVLVPNEIEASMLTGLPAGTVDEAIAAAEALRARGAGRVIVTLGALGAVAVGPGGARRFPAERVVAVDTTAAGDTFIGGFCAAVARGASEGEAIRFAQAAAAISVTRAGAQPSIPSEDEVRRALAAAGA